MKMYLLNRWCSACSTWEIIRPFWELHGIGQRHLPRGDLLAFKKRYFLCCWASFLSSLSVLCGWCLSCLLLIDMLDLAASKACGNGLFWRHSKKCSWQLWWGRECSPWKALQWVGVGTWTFDGLAECGVILSSPIFGISFLILITKHNSFQAQDGELREISNQQTAVLLISFSCDWQLGSHCQTDLWLWYDFQILLG